MADVFISFAKADRSEAVELASLLASHGLNVWWDNELYAGDDFDDLIIQEISTAKSVVVIWSNASGNSRRVGGEANFAAEQSKLLPCHLAGFDLTRIPLHLRKLHSTPLAEQHELLDAVLARVDRDPHKDTPKDTSRTTPKTDLERIIDDELAAEDSLEAYNDGVWAGSPAEAIASYNKAISLNPQFAEAYENRGRANYELGNFSATVRDLTHAIRLRSRDRSKIDPESGGNIFQRLDAILVVSDNECLARSFYNRALAQLALEDYALAIADARRSVRLKHDWAGGHYACAKIHFSTRRFDLAIHDADTVLNLEPKFAAAYAMRGLMALETGQFDRAREQFKQALAIAPDYEDGLWAQQIAQAKLALLNRDIP